MKHLYDVLEVGIMAVALGMDAFSLALGVGLQGLPRNRVVQLSVSIGVAHVLMTLIGISMGMLMQGIMGQIAKWFGALLLLGLGLHMAYTSLFQREEPVAVGTTVAALGLFSIGVSIDALSVGLSLGLSSTTYGIACALAFGFVAAGLCAVGLVIGAKATRTLGVYGELLGAGILMVYGILFMAQ
ncbi:putative manganese efflux pump MntP [Alicyclobacillus contaminans]|uniref:manganese efflux pump MntP n=1 Tax=Alicyclobacillus contaminans TaxID=392016 RepID=UPI000426D960|nr:manganese efflux pump [Alicyclobacillus contaminans]GMA50915.1 putative manganese efflux pump MntP [Alicyclobacillus contaminans]